MFFWGAEKDTSRLESAIFEDLNRYCWSQQNNSNGLSNQPNNTDGQIYTLTVLNGTEPWLRIDNTPDQPTPALDFDSMLGNNFPGYVKTEYTYDDSGFGTDNKDELIAQSQHQQSITVTNNINSTNMSFQNNNNDWQMADHNANIEDETPESLLRSALQGKGYSKGLTIIC
ncbi:hypothetical protein Bhyg_13747 [Pseudolycoriella hygida]|uniref:Uncharacterized protein n=1 Tax=Pseudolycoriella hygida TaxID=35572 RepID=A0A9Q0MQP5_9DIPT|nr:hypothetical protein Bhyg_13747 [Pseudolycoriella hygida]